MYATPSTGETAEVVYVGAVIALKVFEKEDDVLCLSGIEGCVVYGGEICVKVSQMTLILLQCLTTYAGVVATIASRMSAGLVRLMRRASI